MKNSRRIMILDIINKYQIETQEQLCKYLQEAGLNVTQATVSRDIREMKLTKVAIGEDRAIYVSHETNLEYLHSDKLSKQMTVFAEAFLSAQNAQNIVVIKTMSGMANAVAAVVDALKISYILGSIAGDDCIMVVCTTQEAASEFVKKCENMARIN